jgi:hypothetical protein
MLPNDLVVDPRFSSLENSLSSNRPHPDGVRLWANILLLWARQVVLISPRVGVISSQ